MADKRVAEHPTGKSGPYLRVPSLGLLLGSCAFILIVLTSLGALDTPFGNGDEAIYAQNVREIQATGDYGVLRWQGIETYQRPAWPFVLSAWSESAIGEKLGGSEFALRLPMALSSLLILLCIFGGVRRLSGSIGVALASVLLCAGSPTFFTFSRALYSDASLALGTTIALLGTIYSLKNPKGLYATALGMGLALAAKSLAAGPFGLVLLPWDIYSIWRHKAYRTALFSLGVFLSVALPYFVYSYLRFGGAFIEGHFGFNMAQRLKGYNDTVGLPHGSTAYLHHLWTADGLWTLLWIATASLIAAIAFRKGDKGAGCALLSAWGVFAIFSLSQTKLPHYILGIYPAFAIAGGLGFQSLREKWSSMNLTGPSIPLQVPLIGTLLVTTFIIGITRPVPTSYLLPAPVEHSLGKELHALQLDAPLYTIDWYAPVFAYYAQRPWKALFHSKELVAKLNEIRFFGLAQNIQELVDLPTGPFLLAGPKESIEASLRTAGRPIPSPLLDVEGVFWVVHLP